MTLVGTTCSFTEASNGYPMREYHTQIDIAVSVEKLWEKLVDFQQYKTWNPLVKYLKGDMQKGGNIQMFIQPLAREFSAPMLRWEPNREFAWLGIRFGSLKFLLSGEHYYRLERLDANHSRLHHGEYFRGWFSAFIPQKLLKKMKAAFEDHNRQLKEQLEHEN